MYILAFPCGSLYTTDDNNNNNNVCSFHLGYIRTFNTAREQLYPVRHYTDALASQWRITVFLVSSFTILYITGDNPVDIVLHFVDSFKQHNITLIENTQQKIVNYNGTIVDLGRVISIPDGSLSFVVLVLLTQILLSVLSNVEGELLNYTYANGRNVGKIASV